MTPQEILDAIALSAELQSFQAAGDHQAIADALSVGLKRVAQGELKVSARGLASKHPGGPIAAEAVLMKLEGAAAVMLASEVPLEKVTGSLLKRQLGFLNSDGLDFADATLRGMLDQFAVMTILTEQEASDLKDVALVQYRITHEAVTAAIGSI